MIVPALVVLTGGCRRERAGEAAETSPRASTSTSVASVAELPGVTDVALPDGAHGAYPGVSVGADELHLVWMRAGAELSVELASASLHDATLDWSTPQRVAAGSRLLSNWADTPAVAETAGGRIVVAWLEHHAQDPADGYAPRVAATRDDGSFGPAWSPDDVRRGPESGFVGFASTDAGLHMFWLDGRELGGHAHAGGHGSMQLRTLLLDDDGAPVGPSKILDDRTCECCKLGVAAWGERALVVYRDRSVDEVRDTWIAGPELAPTRVAADGWVIAGCPVNGPALAGSGERLFAAWFSGAGDRSAVRLASTRTPERWDPAVDIDLGAPAGRVDLLALPNGEALLSWVEYDEAQPGAARLLARRIDADGRPGPPWAVAAFGAARDWGFPRTAWLGQDVLWVFTDPRDGLSRLRGVRAALPGY